MAPLAPLGPGASIMGCRRRGFCRGQEPTGRGCDSEEEGATSSCCLKSGRR